MLLKKPHEPNDVLSLKLSNGDELIARFVEETDTELVVDKPVLVVPSQNGIGLIQAMFTGDIEKSVNIKKSHIMYAVDTVDRVRDHYIQTTTGIQPVSKGSIVV